MKFWNYDKKNERIQQMIKRSLFLLCFVIIFFLSGVVLFTALRFFLPTTPQSGPPVQSAVPVQKIVSTSSTSPLPVLQSLDQVDLSSSDQQVNDQLTSIVVTGDVLLARSVNAKMVQLNNFRWPWERTAVLLRTADITFINLETPLIADCPLSFEGFIFCGDPRGVDGLTFAGVDVASLANNHAGNWGVEGVASTQEILLSQDIESTGVDNFVVKNVKGIRFAFLGFNETGAQTGIPLLTEELLTAQILQARAVADVIIVQFHWGQEYTHQPTRSQKYWAHLAIDSGADLVVGNHPHWWQPMEFYQGKLIVYSHGNFMFDQMWSQETREGIVGEYFFQGKNFVDVKFHPVLIENYGQPRWLEGEEKNKILNAVVQESKE